MRRTPDLLRRVVTVPVLLVSIPLAAALFVLLLVLTLPVSLLRHSRRRPVRIGGFLLLYLVTDLVGLLAAGAVRLRCLPLSRDDPRRGALDRLLLGRLLRFLHRAGARIFRLRLLVDPPLPSPPPSSTEGLLVLARHAGPGDSFLLVDALMTDTGHRPRIVLKERLRLDPCLDVLLGRLPTCFVPSGHDESGSADRIAELAGTMRGGDALVLFPEGGNFTDRRRIRAIRWLRGHGEYRRATHAALAQHVLPPRTAGILAALAAAPQADVVFVAHTGLDAIDSLATAWRGIPLPSPVRAHWWRVPAAEVPAGEAERTRWLLDQWDRVDTWVGEHREPDGPARDDFN